MDCLFRYCVYQTPSNQALIIGMFSHGCTCTCSRQAGQRVGGYLATIVPLIMHFVQLDEESGDDELRESCLQAFEAFVLRCFREITPHIQGVSRAWCGCVDVCVCVGGCGWVGVFN